MTSTSYSSCFGYSTFAQVLSRGPTPADPAVLTTFSAQPNFDLDPNAVNALLPCALRDCPTPLAVPVTGETPDRLNPLPNAT